MNAIVPVNATPPMTVSDLERIAAAFAQSRMFGVSDPSAALSLCLLAQAEGQHPAIAFRDYSIIQGKPAKKAEAMQRDFLQSGGKIEWIELTDDCAKAKFSHPAGGSTVIDWTMERAKAAGLGGKDMWRKYPRQMLRSRVISEGVRTVCPMATSGMYVPEEVADFENGNGSLPHDPPHDRGTVVGEFVEAEHVPVKEPAAREKLDGPHTSKTALRKAVIDIITKVRKVETLDDLDALKTEHKRTINQALRDWPALIDGDPNIAEDLGLKGEIEKKRSELSVSVGFQFLVSLVSECKSYSDLQSILDEHEAAIDALDGEERRRFDAAYNDKEVALTNPTPMTAGAFGG